MIDDIAQADSPTRTRTRRVILQAAVSVLSHNPAASLGEIADAAEVARSTLHRYFPERSDLLDALRRYASDEIAAATTRARLHEGSAAEALVRLCHEYFDCWDTITWVYMDSMQQESPPSCDDDPLDPGLTALIERGQRDGTIDAALPAAWIQQALWALLYSAWEYVRQGAPKHDALTLCLTTLRKVVTPQG